MVQDGWFARSDAGGHHGNHEAWKAIASPINWRFDFTFTLPRRLPQDAREMDWKFVISYKDANNAHSKVPDRQVGANPATTPREHTEKVLDFFKHRDQWRAVSGSVLMKKPHFGSYRSTSTEGVVKNLNVDIDEEEDEVDDDVVVDEKTAIILREEREWSEKSEILNYSHINYNLSGSGRRTAICSAWGEYELYEGEEEEGEEEEKEVETEQETGAHRAEDDVLAEGDGFHDPQDEAISLEELLPRESPFKLGDLVQLRSLEEQEENFESEIENILADVKRKMKEALEGTQEYKEGGAENFRGLFLPDGKKIFPNPCSYSEINLYSRGLSNSKDMDLEKEDPSDFSALHPFLTRENYSNLIAKLGKDAVGTVMDAPRTICRVRVPEQEKQNKKAGFFGALRGWASSSFSTSSSSHDKDDKNTKNKKKNSKRRERKNSVLYPQYDAEWTFVRVRWDVGESRVAENAIERGRIVEIPTDILVKVNSESYTRVQTNFNQRVLLGKYYLETQFGKLRTREVSTYRQIDHSRRLQNDIYEENENTSTTGNENLISTSTSTSSAPASSSQGPATSTSSTSTKADPRSVKKVKNNSADSNYHRNNKNDIFSRTTSRYFSQLPPNSKRGRLMKAVLPKKFLGGSSSSVSSMMRGGRTRFFGQHGKNKNISLQKDDHLHPEIQRPEGVLEQDEELWYRSHIWNKEYWNEMRDGTILMGPPNDHLESEETNLGPMAIEVVEEEDPNFPHTALLSLMDGNLISDHDPDWAYGSTSPSEEVEPQEGEEVEAEKKKNEGGKKQPQDLEEQKKKKEETSKRKEAKRKKFERKLEEVYGISAGEIATQMDPITLSNNIKLNVLCYIYYAHAQQSYIHSPNSGLSENEIEENDANKHLLDSEVVEVEEKMLKSGEEEEDDEMFMTNAEERECSREVDKFADIGRFGEEPAYLSYVLDKEEDDSNVSRGHLVPHQPHFQLHAAGDGLTTSSRREDFLLTAQNRKYLHLQTTAVSHVEEVKGSTAVDRAVRLEPSHIEKKVRLRSHNEPLQWHDKNYGRVVQARQDRGPAGKQDVIKRRSTRPPLAMRDRLLGALAAQLKAFSMSPFPDQHVVVRSQEEKEKQEIEDEELLSGSGNIGTKTKDRSAFISRAGGDGKQAGAQQVESRRGEDLDLKYASRLKLYRTRVAFDKSGDLRHLVDTDWAWRSSSPRQNAWVNFFLALLWTTDETLFDLNFKSKVNGSSGASSKSTKASKSTKVEVPELPPLPFVELGKYWVDLHGLPGGEDEQNNNDGTSKSIKSTVGAATSSSSAGLNVEGQEADELEVTALEKRVKRRSEKNWEQDMFDTWKRGMLKLIKAYEESVSASESNSEGRKRYKHRYWHMRATSLEGFIQATNKLDVVSGPFLASPEHQEANDPFTPTGPLPGSVLWTSLDNPAFASAAKTFRRLKNFFSQDEKNHVKSVTTKLREQDTDMKASPKRWWESSKVKERAFRRIGNLSIEI